MKNNIYCIYSTSYRLLEKELNKILKDNNYTTYNADEVDTEDIFENANYINLFMDKNYMVVKNVNWFSSKKRGNNEEIEEEKVDNKDQVILSYLENPNKNTVLILILNDKMNGQKKISKLIKENYNYIELLEYNVKELREEINKYLKKNKINIDYDGVSYIINNSLNKYDIVMNELDKILLYGKKDLDLKDLTNIISVGVLDNNFKFLDAVMDKDLKEIFRYYDDYILNKNYPVIFMTMLANEYRKIYFIKTLLNKRNKSELRSLLKVKYDFQMDKLIRYSYSYSEKELEDNLVLLCDLDYQIKQGKMNDKVALEWFFIKICS